MKLPQLSLRDLFGFILIAAILCGWLTSELQWRKYAARTAAAQKAKMDKLKRDAARAVESLARKLQVATAGQRTP